MERAPYINNQTHLIEKKSKQKNSLFFRFRQNKTAVIGLFILVILVIMALFAEQIAPYSYEKQNLQNLFATPSAKHLFGTDNFGRDVFSRVVYGSRISLVIGFISVGIGCLVGGILGVVSAYYGGIADHVIMRILDIAQSIPSLLLAVSLSATLGPGLKNAMIAVGISSIPTYARIIRGSVLNVKGEDFIDAAIVGGAGSGRIIFKHILPNTMAPIIIQASAGMAGAILTAASLSFIGLGVQPPTAEWGSMIATGRAYLRNAWWIVTFPGAAIMITVSALNLLGDGLRDVLDPKSKKG